MIGIWDCKVVIKTGRCTNVLQRGTATPERKHTMQYNDLINLIHHLFYIKINDNNEYMYYMSINRFVICPQIDVWVNSEFVWSLNHSSHQMNLVNLTHWISLVSFHSGGFRTLCFSFQWRLVRPKRSESYPLGIYVLTCTPSLNLSKSP